MKAIASRFLRLSWALLLAVLPGSGVSAAQFSRTGPPGETPSRGVSPRFSLPEAAVSAKLPQGPASAMPASEMALAAADPTPAQGLPSPVAELRAAAIGGAPVLDLFIDGQWRRGSGETLIPVVDPATGRELHQAPNATPAECDAAVACAQAAFASWSALARQQRGRKLVQWADNIKKRRVEIATIMSREMGKTLGETQGEVDLGAVLLEKMAEIFGVNEGRHDVKKPTDPAVVDYFSQVYGFEMDKLEAYEQGEPIGVGLVVSPFNFPFALPLESLAPALLVGNTVVWKPSENAPLTALELVKASEGVLPKGVLNLVYGDGAVGRALVEDKRVDVVSFTGSVAVGREIKKLSAQIDTRRPPGLELGGNNAQVVLPDADTDLALKHVMLGVCSLSGQQCNHTQRLILVKDKPGAAQADYAPFLGKLTAAMRDFRVGPGLEPTSQMGPIVSAKQLARLERQVEGLLKVPGAVLLTGGRRLGYDESGRRLTADDPRYSKEAALADGSFYAPTVILDRTADKRLGHAEEIFGPVLIVKEAADPEEGIRLANDTEYGLTGSMYSRDIEWLRKNLRRINAGGRYGNLPTNYDVDTMTTILFGGFARSLSSLNSAFHVLGAHWLALWEQHTANIIAR